MTLSLLQLNINADNYWDNLFPYLTSNDFDIIQLQEVCGKETICGNLNCTHDCFDELTKLLSAKYNGEMIVTQRYTSSPTSYMGNATFYKKEFSLVDKYILSLYKNITLFPQDAKNFED